MEKLRLGIIGLGKRSQKILKLNILPMENVRITAFCDVCSKNIEEALKMIDDKPFCTTDYNELLERDDVDAVYICTGWDSHIEIALKAMYKGKYAGMEVGGAYSIEECFALVRAHEETGTHCMILENCCYSRTEMMCLNMARKGLFGTIVHCSGGYRHDLRKELSDGKYRLFNYMHRNCDNYPTHQLGPICKMLNINSGNRLLSLVSMASKAEGMHEYILQKKGQKDPMSSYNFAQGDIITTIIKCAGGETITLTLDTTLPRPYSRDFTISGTKGFYQEQNNSFFFECDREKYGDEKLSWDKNWNNAKEYEKEYDHPLWRGFVPSSDEEKSIYMNNLLFSAFFESALKKKSPPIDVYDAAAWAAVSALSEESVAMGGRVMSIPDFTGGKWINFKGKDILEKYKLD